MPGPNVSIMGGSTVIERWLEERTDPVVLAGCGVVVEDGRDSRQHSHLKTGSCFSVLEE